MIKTINRLLGICDERKKGYEAAANDVENHKVATIFKHLAMQSESFKGQLAPFMATATAESEEHKIEDLFTDWMDFKSEISGEDENGIINTCEIGETNAISAYEEVLENPLPNSLRTLAQDHLLKMKNTLELLDDLKQKV